MPSAATFNTPGSIPVIIHRGKAFHARNRRPRRSISRSAEVFIPIITTHITKQIHDSVSVGKQRTCANPIILNTVADTIKCARPIILTAFKVIPGVSVIGIIPSDSRNCLRGVVRSFISDAETIRLFGGTPPGHHIHGIIDICPTGFRDLGFNCIKTLIISDTQTADKCCTGGIIVLCRIIL